MPNATGAREKKLCPKQIVVNREIVPDAAVGQKKLCPKQLVVNREAVPGATGMKL